MSNESSQGERERENFVKLDDSKTKIRKIRPEMVHQNCGCLVGQDENRKRINVTARGL